MKNSMRPLDCNSKMNSSLNRGDVQHPSLDLSHVEIEFPNFDEMTQQRMARNRQVMQAADRAVAQEMFPEANMKSKQTNAAVCIQKMWRGLKGRQVYVTKLFEKYQEDENRRIERIERQVHEGELLVENYNLERSLRDSKTVRRNRDRQILSHVITIQRAWRTFIKRKTAASLPEDISSAEIPSATNSTSQAEISSCSPITLVSDKDGVFDTSASLDSTWRETSDHEDENSETESASATRTMTVVLTPEENQGGGEDNSQATSVCDSTGDLASPLLDVDTISLQSGTDSTTSCVAVPCIAPVLDSTDILSGLEREKKSPSRFSVDVECESVTSDYSELGGPLKDIEKEVHYLDREALKTSDIEGGGVGRGCSLLGFGRREDLPESDSFGLDKREDETEEDFQRRLRKANLLSLAQEFAQLKKVDAQADAIDFHRSNTGRAFRHSNTPSPLTSRGQSLERAGRTKSKSPLRSAAGKPGPIVASAASTASAMPSRNSLANAPANNFTQAAANNLNGNGNYWPANDLPVNEARRRSDLNSSDLPANMRPGRQNNSQTSKNFKMQGSQGSGDHDGDFDVYNIENTMPNLDWETLEKHLEKAANEEKSLLEACKNEREEIRRRLAMADDDDITLTSGPDDLDLSPRNARLQAKLQGTQNMQICFMNDDLLDEDDADDDDDTNATTDNDESSSRLQESTTSTQPDSDDNSTVSDPNTVPSPNHPCYPGEIAHFTSRQSQLQTEATIALAQASTMARMQLEVEKQSKKKSPIADMVGIPTLGKGRKLRLSYNKLNEMNIAQLQVLVNDLHTQIELLNEDLVHLLIERDDLHMEQDSMLVDIEDLTSHCQDPKTTNNNKSNHDNNRPGSRRDRFK